MDQADFPGDTIGYINFAPFLIRTPVIDTHQLELAVPGVHHTDYGAKGKIGVCGSEGFRVEALAIGGFAAVLTRGGSTRNNPPRPEPRHRVTEMRHDRSVHTPGNHGTEQ